MSNFANNDALGTSHKSCVHLVCKSETNYVDHSKDIGQVVNDDSLSIKRLDNEANDTTVDTIVYDNTPAAAVSPTDNSITHTQVLTAQVATHDNLSDDNGTKVSLEKAAVQEVVTQQKLHGSNNNDPFHSHLEFDKSLQLLEQQPKDNATEMEKNGLSIDYSKRVTFQGDIIDRISAVSKIITKKSPKEDNGLTCEKKVCQNKFNPCLDIKNTPTKDDTRKKSRSKSSKRGIAKFTSDYWQHGLQTFDESSSQLSAAATNQKSQSGSPSAIFPSHKRKPPKGVYETTAGNYQVRLYYQSSLQYIGTFQTLKQATLAHEIAWSMLKKDEGLQLTTEECERNIKLAKEAAWNVNKDGKQSGNDTRKKRRSQSRSSSAIFPSSTINYLNECSRLNPYPDADQTARICIVTGLNNIQVEEWMSSARKKRLSVEAKTHINKWIEEHSINPYPTREVKDAWIKLYGIENDSQLDGYLYRARKNIKENSTMKNDVSSLKTCGLCNIQKKEWSYTFGEWNKLDDRDRLCKYCISKVRNAFLLNDDVPVAVNRTRTGRIVRPKQRLVAIPQDTSLKRGKGQPVKRKRKRPKKITSARGTATSGGSTSQTIARKDMMNKNQGVRRQTGCKNRWGAVLKVCGNDIFLGSYKTQAEAAYAVEMAKEESKMRSSMTSGDSLSFTGNTGQAVLESSSADLHDMPSDKIGESLMDTETAEDEELSASISKYLSPEYQSEKQAEEQHKDQDEDEPADNLIADAINIPIESVVSKFEEARKAGYQPKTFDLQSYMAENDKKYSYLIEVKNDSTNISNKRRKKSTPKRLIGGL